MGYQLPHLDTPVLCADEQAELDVIISSIEDDDGFDSGPTTLIESTTSARILAVLIVECLVSDGSNYRHALKTAWTQLGNCLPAPVPSPSAS